MCGQDIALQRRIIVAERGYELVATITNYGVEEAGITGVHLAAVSGLLVETDADGHYPLADIDPEPRARGVISFLMRRNCMSSGREWCWVQLCIPAGLPSMLSTVIYK